MWAGVVQCGLIWKVLANCARCPCVITETDLLMEECAARLHRMICKAVLQFRLDTAVIYP